MPMLPRPLAIVCALTLVSIGCSATPAPGEPGAQTSPGGGEAGDGAMADLEESAAWTSPSCRWLETGAWVLASPQETALLRAAHELGYIEMAETGQGNRFGTPEPAWKITLTETGEAEASQCPPSSKSTVWGLPVSRRELMSGTPAGTDAGGRTIYDVEFAWVPTDAGERVTDVLTGNMTVEEGTYRTKVYLQKGPGISGGPNGWYVNAINDLGATRQ
jgi:hypothetical protein